MGQGVELFHMTHVAFENSPNMVALSPIKLPCSSVLPGMSNHFIVVACLQRGGGIKAAGAALW